ncbi:MAG: rhodanese-like domain-containing protein [Gammaproteobacteria bacterium]
MKFEDLVKAAQQSITELFPWDLEEALIKNPNALLIDVREPDEYQAMHILHSINIPRGVLESACEYNYEDTVPELVEARNRDVIVICRSGKRSALAAYSMQQLGFQKVASLNTGLRGWSDYELKLFDESGNIISEAASEEYFTPQLKPEQLSPK